jgi:hypothetical protein
VAAAPFLVVVMWISNSKLLMGDYVNGKAAKALGWLTAAVMTDATAALFASGASACDGPLFGSGGADPNGSRGDRISLPGCAAPGHRASYRRCLRQRRLTRPGRRSTRCMSP